MKRAVFLCDTAKSGARTWWTWTLLAEISASWDCILASLFRRVQSRSNWDASGPYLVSKAGKG